MQSLSRALSPIPSSIALTLVIVAVITETVLASMYDAEISASSSQFWELMMGSVWSWWVYVNRRHLGLGYPLGFDALVFFAWPVVVPYYLINRASRNVVRPAIAIKISRTRFHRYTPHGLSAKI